MDTHETTIYTAVLITAVVIGCIIFYFAISVFRYQRRHIEMQRNYFLNEVTILEKERTRIARDLHDEIGPLLSLTKIQLNTLPPLLEKTQIQVLKAESNLETIIERLGQIARNLTPSSLMKKGLHFALQDYLANFDDIIPMKLELRYQVHQDLPLSLTIHLFRIVQEVVHNSIKHSGGSALLVQLKQKGHTLYIFCKDNGSGFNKGEENQKETGLGLNSIQNRTRMLGGKMKCHSTPASGTEYFFEIPLKHNYGYAH